MSMINHSVTVERHDEPFTEIRTAGGTRIARLVEFHHEAAGWADAAGRGAVVLRPRDYDGCPCARCMKGWTAAQGNPRDRELDGDRLGLSGLRRIPGSLRHA